MTKRRTKPKKRKKSIELNDNIKLKHKHNAGKQLCYIHKGFELFWKYDLDECTLINESSLFSAAFEQGGKFSCY